MKLLDNSLKTNWKFIAIVVVLGLAVGVGTIWYANSLRIEPQSTQAIIPRPTPSPTQIELDTSTWQTYRNDEFGFEFQYPQDWDALESKSPGYPYLAYVNLGPKSSIQEGGVFAVIVRDQDKNTYLNSVRNGGFVVKREEEVMIYGEKATRYMFTRMNSSGEWKNIIIMRGNVLLEFSSGATEGQDEKFHQILSTFRFVDSLDVLADEEKIKKALASTSRTWIRLFDERFPDDYNHLLEIWYPENWFCSCANDADFFSIHSLYPIRWSEVRIEQPVVDIIDYFPVGCPGGGSSCAIDKTIRISSKQFLKNMQNEIDATGTYANMQDLEKTGEFYFDQLNITAPIYRGKEIYESGTISIPIKLYFIDTGRGMSAIVFRYPDKLSTPFIAEFLNRITIAQK